MPWGRLQICVAAVSQKLLPHNIIAILNILKLKVYNILPTRLSRSRCRLNDMDE
jgi:hypothetical protein